MTSETGTSEDEVLASNRAFYDAFQALDLDAMSRVWAERSPVSCIHPGWALVSGRDRVIASWTGIFKGTEQIRFSLHDVRAFVIGQLAWVVLVEEIEAKQSGQLVRAFALTTNTFLREANTQGEGGWKLVHHHAAPTPPPTRPKVGPVLH